MRLFNADALIVEIKTCLWDWESVNGIKAKTVLNQTITDIGNMPTIDSVPVVRCKDCKHRDTINCGMQFYGNDDDGHLCKSDDWTQDDGFCYWGERKDV